MKIIYDTQGKPSGRVYTEDANGHKHFYPFYKIDLYDGFEQPRIRFWPTAKMMRDYFAAHP